MSKAQNQSITVQPIVMTPSPVPGKGKTKPRVYQGKEVNWDLAETGFSITSIVFSYPSGVTQDTFWNTIPSSTNNWVGIVSDTIAKGTIISYTITIVDSDGNSMSHDPQLQVGQGGG